MTTGDNGRVSSLTVGAFWIVTAKTLAFAFSFVLPLLLVRRLTQEDIGLYKQAFLVVGTASAVFSLSFGSSAFYFLPRERDRQPSVVLNILLFNLLMGGLAFAALLFFPGVLESVFNSSKLVGHAPLIGLVILFWLFSHFLEVVALAHQELRAATVFIVLAQLSKTALMLAAALQFASVGSLLYAALAQGVLQTAILLLYLRSRFPGLWRSFDRSMLRAQLAYALPLGLYGLLYTFSIDLHNYFVSHQFGEVAFAIYSYGCFNLPLVGILAESVGGVMIPRVSLLEKQGALREILVVTSRAMRKLAVAYFPIYALLMVVGPEFITVMFTEQYAASWPVFAVNLTLVPFGILALDPLTRAFGEYRYYLLRVRVAVFVAQTAALWYVTTRYGLVEAIAVVVGGALVERGVIALKFGRVLGARWEDARLLKDVGKVAAATLAAAGVAVVVRSLTAGARPLVVLAGCGAAFSLAYLGGLVALGVPEPEERGAARRALTRLRALLPRRSKTGETLAGL